jgi:hypothetical protein
MKKIEFLVPISYTIPTILCDTTKTTPDHLCFFFDSVAYMIEYMTPAMIHNTTKNLIHTVLQETECKLKQEKEYTTQLQYTLQTEKEKYENLLIQYNTTRKQEYEHELEMYKQHTNIDIEQLKKQLKETTIMYQSELKTKKNEQQYLHELYTLNLKDKDTTLNNIQVRIDEMMSIFKNINSSNTSKGKFGENCVNYIIQQYFPHAEIQDVSKIPHSGDTVIHLENTILMIEIKTKKHVTKEDIVKFEKDVLTHVDDYNGALFVTTSTGIPTKGEYCFELLNNTIPVLYITKIIDNPELLHIGIYLLLHVIPIFKKFELSSSSSLTVIEEKNKQLLSTLSSVLQTIHLTCDVIKQNQKTYICMEKQIKIQKKNNEEMLKKCKEEIHKLETIIV